MMIEVVIADGHPLLLEGVKNVLTREGDIEISGEATTCGEVIDMVTRRLPDLLIMDITMPGKNGLDSLKDVKAFFPKLPVLILTIHPEERFAVRCLRAGASGYLSKSTMAAELPKAVRKIVKEKRKYIPPKVTEQLSVQIYEDDRPPHELLTDREFEVLCLIADGNKIPTIAQKLSLSPHTVHTYRSRIKEKLNLTTNVEMVRYALGNNLVS